MTSRRRDYGDSSANQVGGKFRQTVVLAPRPAVFDDDVIALNKARLLQALAKSTQPVRERVWCGGTEEADHRHRRLLRARRERPADSRAAQTADEVSTSDWTAQHVFSTLPVGTIITVSPGTVPVLG